MRRSVLFSNVWVREGAYLEEGVVLPDVRVGQGAVLRKVVIDRGCIIPAGMSIGVNPAEDAKRFYVTDGGVTLVTPEMLGQNRHLIR